MKPGRTPPPDKGLGEPITMFDDTFSAETVVMNHFFPDQKECPRCRGAGRVGLYACNDCGATGIAHITSEGKT